MSTEEPTLQHLFVRAAQAGGRNKRQPVSVDWRGRRVIGAYSFSVPKKAFVTAEILSCTETVAQGFDLKVKGGLTLADGTSVKTLRTWHDPRLEPSVTYPFRCSDGLLRTWNIYNVVRAGRIFEEMWTGNAGMLVEEVTVRSALFRCSSGVAPQPDFDSFVYRVTVHD